MTIDKKSAIIALVWFVIGCICGFFMCKGVYDRPIKETIVRDTVTVTDTISRYYPKPVSIEKVRTEYKWLTRVEHLADTSKMIAVEVPITSKHYGSKDYDAWVSGYEPSLDSIKVYKETQYITETITKTVKDKGKHFFLDVGAGCEYQFNGKTAVPFAELGARLKIGKVGIGAYGGYSHDIKENKASPIVKAKVTYDIMCF